MVPLHPFVSLPLPKFPFLSMHALWAPLYIPPMDY